MYIDPTPVSKEQYEFLIVDADIYIQVSTLGIGFTT